MRAVISTNGTRITRDKARELKAVGLSYVGISLDGGEAVHDRFRGVPGAFKKALQGIENCQNEGLKVGLRFTINRGNVTEVPLLFELLRDLEVPRICFYHLVYAGRGSALVKEDLDHAATRAVVNLIMRWDSNNLESLWRLTSEVGRSPEAGLGTVFSSVGFCHCCARAR